MFVCVSYACIRAASRCGGRGLAYAPSPPHATLAHTNQVCVSVLAVSCALCAWVCAWAYPPGLLHLAALSLLTKEAGRLKCVHVCVQSVCPLCWAPYDISLLGRARPPCALTALLPRRHFAGVRAALIPPPAAAPPEPRLSSLLGGAGEPTPAMPSHVLCQFRCAARGPAAPPPAPAASPFHCLASPRLTRWLPTAARRRRLSGAAPGRGLGCLPPKASSACAPARPRHGWQAPGCDLCSVDRFTKLPFSPFQAAIDDIMPTSSPHGRLPPFLSRPSHGSLSLSSLCSKNCLPSCWCCCCAAHAWVCSAD